MNNQLILIVEDNLETAKNIQLFLTHHGYQCHLATTGKSAIEHASQNTYDLIVLDVMLPEGNGLIVCKTIRMTSNVPIIMLTAKVEEKDLISGLNAGADDYIKKPYSNKELVARIKTHLRRYLGTEDILQVGPYTLNKESRSVSANGHVLKLTRTELELLSLLLNQPNRVYSREHLISLACPHPEESFDRTVDVHFHNIRRKIKTTGLAEHGISAVYGIGYKLNI